MKNLADFERDRALAIVARWRDGESLEDVAEYAGLPLEDCAKIINDALRNRPTIGLTPPFIWKPLDALHRRMDCELPLYRAKDLLKETTSHVMRQRLEAQIAEQEKPLGKRAARWKHLGAKF